MNTPLIGAHLAPSSTRVKTFGGRVALVAALSLSAATAAPAMTTASAATTPRYSYTGSAFGTSVTVGSVVKSGRSAALTFGCTTDAAIRKANNSAGLDLAPLAKTGVTTTTGDSFSSPVRSRTSASTATVNLLSGLVKATAVKAVSSTTRTSTGTYSLSSTGTTLTGLVVAGRAVRADAAPNTRLTVPGFGYVIVNEQVRRTNGLTVNGLHLVITTTNAFGVAVGSNVIVSDAVTALSGPVSGVLSGYSYGTYAKSGTAVLSGSSFPEFLPCLGTAGVRRDNTGAGITLGTTLRTGTIVDTAKGTVTATSASGETTSSVQAADVLNGVVKATAVKADAHAARTTGAVSLSDSGSTFGSLTVKGHSEITAHVAPNTQVALRGVGTLYLHRVAKNSTTVQVTMIQLVLSSPVNGLPVGTDIRVATARAGVN